MNDLRVLLYARVSSPGQKRRREAVLDEPSLAQQIEEMRRAAERRGWLIVGELEEVSTGGAPLKERPAGAQVYEKATEDGFDVLLVYDNDRIGRDEDAVIAKLFRADMRSFGKQIFSVHQPVEPKPPAEYQPYEDDAALWLESVSDTASSVYIRQFRRRHTFGMRKRIEEKKLLAGGLATGYTAQRHVLPSGKTFLGERRLDPVYAPIVQRVFGAYEAGASLRTIAGELNQEGSRTPSGHLWTCTTIRGIIQNPVYYGAAAYYRTRGVRKRGPARLRWPARARQPMDRWLIVEDAHHPPIISKEQWQHCQRLRQERHRFGRTLGDSPLLSGLLRCGSCGAAMQRSGNWKGGAYACSRYSKTGLADCHPNSIRRLWLEAHILEYLTQLARSPELLAQLCITQTQSRLLELEAEERGLAEQIAAVNARRAKAREAYEAGVDTVTEYAQHKQALGEQEEALAARQTAIAADKRRLGEQQEAEHSLTQIMAEFPERFLRQPLRAQKALLREIIEKIVIRDRQAHIVFKSDAFHSSDYERTLTMVRAYSEGQEAHDHACHSCPNKVEAGP